jgi:hypothetical protein
METTYSTETAVGFQRTTLRYIPEDIILQVLISQGKFYHMELVIGQFNEDRPIAEAVRHWFLSVEARVQSLMTSCGVTVDEVAQMESFVQASLSSTC